MTDRPFYIQQDDSPGKARILIESLRLFAQHGLAGTSIRDIAAATRMSNPALYKHFKTKHDLALVLFDRLYREHLKRLTVATQNAPDFQAKLAAFVETYLAAYDEHPNATIFTTDSLTAIWPDVQNDLKSRSVITLLRQMLEQGRAEGDVAKDQDIDLQMSLVLGMLGQVTRQLFFQSIDGPAGKHAGGIVHLLKSGLSP